MVRVMIRIALVVSLASLMLAAPASAQNGKRVAQAPETKAAPKVQGAPISGRYRFSPIDGGVMRFDTENGGVTHCTQKDGAWNCVSVPDDRAALTAENDRLKAQDAAQRNQAAELLKELSDQRAAARAEVAKAQAAAKADTEKMQAAAKADVDKMQAAAKADVEKLRADNAALARQVAELREQSTALRTQTQDLQKQLSALDQRAAQDAELAKLKGENGALKDEIAAYQDQMQAMQKKLAELQPPSTDKGENKTGELKMPSKEDMERARAVLEDTWRRVVDMIQNLQKEWMRKSGPV